MINKYCDYCNGKIDIDYEEYKIIKNKFYHPKCAELITSKDYKDERKAERKESIFKILIWIVMIICCAFVNTLIHKVAGNNLGLLLVLGVILIPLGYKFYKSNKDDDDDKE